MCTYLPNNIKLKTKTKENCENTASALRTADSPDGKASETPSWGLIRACIYMGLFFIYEALSYTLDSLSSYWENAWLPSEIQLFSPEEWLWGRLLAAMLLNGFMKACGGQDSELQEVDLSTTISGIEMIDLGNRGEFVFIIIKYQFLFELWTWKFYIGTSNQVVTECQSFSVPANL